MGQMTLPGNPLVEITLRRSARAKRLSLRVSQLDGRVTLTLPRGVSEHEARAFAAEKTEWIKQAIGKRVAPVDIVAGAELPIEGVARRIVVGEVRSARLLPTSVIVPEARPGKTLQAFLKHLARDRLADAVDRYASEVGRPVGRISLRDTRSRWGSCTSDGNLMFSWRLAIAPPQVLDYVAAHEVAHLVHMDHSPAFWSLVSKICPGQETHRQWLRREGAALHRYRF